MAWAWRRAPALRGYVRFQARPTSDTILEADRDDPLLVRWQYGLGRAAVFTSDAKNRWADELGDVAGLRPLVGQHLPRPAAARPAERNHRRFRPRLERAGGGLPPVAATCPSPAAIPDIYAFGPNGFQAPLKVSKVAAGHYRGRLGDRAEPGPVPRASRWPNRAPSPRWASTGRKTRCMEYGNNEQLLRQIAASTGGRFNPPPKAVFDAGGAQHPVHHGAVAGPAGAGLAAEPGGAGAAQVEGRAGSAAPEPGGSDIAAPACGQARTACHQSEPRPFLRRSGRLQFSPAPPIDHA